MSSYYFCLDFGNTRRKLAIMQEDRIIEVVNIQDAPSLKKYLDIYQPPQSILSSVIHHEPEIEDLLRTHTHFHLLHHRTPLPYTLAFPHKETMGADRLALIAGTVTYRPTKTHYLVISLGTCITYNFVHADGLFLGGNITPGVRMRFQSMHEHTAFLPLVDLEPDFPLIGYDTKTNLTSGVFLGVENEIKGFIKAYQSQYQGLVCILTGGDAVFFAKRLKKKIFVEKYFIFKGLYEIIRFQGA